MQNFIFFLEKRNCCGDVEVAGEPDLHGVCRLELLHEPGLPHPLHLHPGQLQGAGADGGGGQLRHQHHRHQQHGGQAYPGNYVTENEQVSKEKVIVDSDLYILRIHGHVGILF